MPINSYAKTYFEKVSKATKGKCEVFDPNSANATKQLTDFIAQSILSKLSDDEKLCKNLV